MLGKLRPVGSRVPRPAALAASNSLPWSRFYVTEYTASGTEALSMAIDIAITRKPKVPVPEIILPAYGCPDLVAAVIAQGGAPVLVDFMPNTPFMNVDCVRDAISPSTVAVVAAGFLGIPERLESLSEVCEDQGVFLIEDSAQCFPPASSEIPRADCVVLSFGRGKPINLMGGGALLIRNELAESSGAVLERYPVLTVKTNIQWRIKRLLFNLLMARVPYWLLEQLPFLKIGETRFHQCNAIRRLNLPSDLVAGGIDAFKRRPVIHTVYDRELEAIEQFGWKRLGLRNADNTRIDASWPRIRYAVLAPNTELRDRAVQALNKAGIGASCFYRAILPEIEGLDKWVECRGYTNAREFASRLITLPCHEDVTANEVAIVAKVLGELSSCQSA